MNYCILIFSYNVIQYYTSKNYATITIFIERQLGLLYLKSPDATLYQTSGPPSELKQTQKICANPL